MGSQSNNKERPVWNHWRCSFDCASWGVKQPYDCCLRAIKFGSRPTAGDFRGKVRPLGVAGFVGVSLLERLQLLDTLVWSLEVLVDNQVKQSSLGQGYFRWLPVGCPFQGSHMCMCVYIYIWVADKITYYPQSTWPKWVVHYRMLMFSHKFKHPMPTPHYFSLPLILSVAHI